MSICQTVDDKKALIDQKRPFEGELLNQLKQYYKIGLTYSSNALEGNSLTISETKVILEDGLTVGGKPLRDTFEAIGHSFPGQKRIGRIIILWNLPQSFTGVSFSSIHSLTVTVGLPGC